MGMFANHLRAGAQLTRRIPDIDQHIDISAIGAIQGYYGWLGWLDDDGIGGLRLGWGGFGWRQCGDFELGELGDLG